MSYLFCSQCGICAVQISAYLIFVGAFGVFFIIPTYVNLSCLQTSQVLMLWSFAGLLSICSGRMP